MDTGGSRVWVFWPGSLLLERLSKPWHRYGTVPAGKKPPFTPLLSNKTFRASVGPIFRALRPPRAGGLLQVNVHIMLLQKVTPCPCRGMFLPFLAHKRCSYGLIDLKNGPQRNATPSASLVFRLCTQKPYPEAAMRQVRYSVQGGRACSYFVTPLGFGPGCTCRCTHRLRRVHTVSSYATRWTTHN